jgi:hypothetical protein
VLIGVLGGLLMAATVAALTGVLVVRVVDGSHRRTGTSDRPVVDISQSADS